MPSRGYDTHFHLDKYANALSLHIFTYMSTNVVKPIINLSFGAGLYHQFMVLLGMFYSWVANITLR
jgi:hypothetical protein